MDLLDQRILRLMLGLHVILAVFALRRLFRRGKCPDTWIWAIFITVTPIAGPFVFYTFYLAPPPLPRDFRAAPPTGAGIHDPGAETPPFRDYLNSAKPKPSKRQRRAKRRQPKQNRKKH